MKYLFGMSKGTLLNMLGGLFGCEFAANSTVTQTNAEFVTEAFDIIRGDLFHVVADSSGSHHLHIELQTRPDGHIAIRVFNYDMGKAMENQRLGGNGKTVRYILPKTIVIHVEEGGGIPDSYEFELVDIKEDGTEEVIRRMVPVVKYWELSDEELLERQLYPLLPLRVFLLRGELKKYAAEEESENKRKLIEQIKALTEKTITEAKRLAESGKIKKGDADRIVTALGRLIKYLNEQYNFDSNLNKEVDRVVESVFTTLEKRGIEKGKMEIAEEMILNNEPLETIIKYSKLTEKKIKQLAKKLSKKISQKMP